MRTPLLVPVTHLPEGMSLPRVLFLLGFVLFAVLSTLHYTHAANESREASIILSNLSNITAVVDRLDKSKLTTNTLAALLPADNLVTPWGSSVSVEEANQHSYTLKIPMTPARVCKRIKNEIKQNAHVLADATTCPHSGSVTFLYTVA